MEENIQKVIEKVSSDTGNCMSQAGTIEALAKSLMWLRIANLAHLLNMGLTAAIKIGLEKYDKERTK